MPYNVKIELESLLKEINQVVRASSIYLFGSYAYGEPTEDSDLDICIVTDDKSKGLAIPIILYPIKTISAKERATLACPKIYDDKTSSLSSTIS